MNYLVPPFCLLAGWLAGVMTTHWRLQEAKKAGQWKELAAEVLAELQRLRPSLEAQSKTFDKLDGTVGKMIEAFVRAKVIRREERGRMTGEEEMGGIRFPAPPQT